MANISGARSMLNVPPDLERLHFPLHNYPDDHYRTLRYMVCSSIICRPGLSVLTGRLLARPQRDLSHEAGQPQRLHRQSMSLRAPRGARRRSRSSLRKTTTTTIMHVPAHVQIYAFRAWPSAACASSWNTALVPTRKPSPSRSQSRRRRRRRRCSTNSLLISPRITGG